MMKTITKYFFTVVLFLIAAVVSFGSVKAGQSENKDAVYTQQLEERVAPVFKLEGLDRREYQLQSFRDSLPVLVWFTNFCEGCQANIPYLDSVYQSDIKPHAELLAISLLGNDRKTVDSLSSKLKFNFPILFDPEGKTCKDYVGSYVPASCPITNLFLIDQNGKIRYEAHFPGFKLKEVIQQINELSNQSQNTTR